MRALAGSIGALGLAALLVDPALAGPPVARCPGGAFDAFLAAFAESVPLQRRYTTIPLRLVLSDPDVPGGRRFVDVRRYEAIPIVENTEDGRLMPNSSTRRRHGLATEVEQERGRVLVSIFKPDTDAIVIYRFRRDGGCWQLFEVEDLNPS